MYGEGDWECDWEGDWEGDEVVAPTAARYDNASPSGFVIMAGG